MSIFARNVRAPSGNSPAFIRASRSRFSSIGTIAETDSLCRAGDIRRSPPASYHRHRLYLCARVPPHIRKADRNNPKRSAAPAEVLVGPTIDQPFHIGHDRIDILGFFLRRVGIVHADVANSAELVCDAEVEANRFRVTDVQISVRLGRETRADRFVFPSPKIVRHNIADKIGGSRSLARCAHCRATVADKSVEMQKLEQRARFAMM